MVLGVSFVRGGRGPAKDGFTKTAQRTIISKAKRWFSGFGNMVKSVVGPVVKSHNTISVGRVHVRAPVDISEVAPVIAEGESISSEHGADVAIGQCVDNSNYKPDLPEFSGKVDWEDYYLMFCAAADLAQWNDNRRFVELWLNLKGEAAEVCADVFSQPGLPTFQALVNALRDRFQTSGIDMVPAEQEQCDESLIPIEVERGRAQVRGVADGGLKNRKVVELVQDMQYGSKAKQFRRLCPLTGERPSRRGRGRGSLSRPRGDREGGRGWRGSVQEEGLGKRSTPDNAIGEEN